MPAVKTKRISTLIESQLPEFITTEYELFGKFIQKYYEQQEVQGGTLDVINNIQKYADIDFYEKNLLKQNDSLSSTISASDTTITLTDASSFPEKNGYVKIDDEIVFYESRNDTELLNCSRGVSGNTKLGDLYETTNFTSTTATSHEVGAKVHNISNLFLYAFIKNFEAQYLGSFPEKYLKGDVDKRTLIKNIQEFYKVKGTKSSIQFIFNTIVAKTPEDKPVVYNPRDFTYKSSNSDWVNVYAVKAKVISGDPRSLIGQKIVQTPGEGYGYASATVDNVKAEGTSDGEVIWNFVLAPETVNGTFGVSTKTRLERPLSDSADEDDRISVFSTTGWDFYGEILIGEERIKFKDKTVNQFIIDKRGNTPLNYNTGEFVYKPVIIDGPDVRILTLGIVYDVAVDSSEPFSSPGDSIQVSQPGFVTSDPKIVQTGTNNPRWILNSWDPVSAPINPTIEASLSEVTTNVNAIFEDDQYYYITSSGYPSYNILDRFVLTESTKDQKILRIIRKQATATTEIYKTPKSEVGILLNGVRVYGYKDDESINFGKLERIDVNTRGRSYVNPPFVLIDDLPNKARAVLTGQVLDSIIVDTNDTFINTPTVEVTSGRNAKATAVVTGGEITSIVVDNPGEFYSSPPNVIIRDKIGRGRFAEFVAVVDTDGSITSIEKIAGGTLYTQENVEVEIVAVGEGATAIPYLKEWNKNRYFKYKEQLDSQFGYVFKNYNNVLEYGYGQLANPKALRVSLGDNLNSADTEPTIKTHSPILGFAYDGNPIYGPFGHQNPLDSSSPIVRMTSSYSLRGDRTGGPATRNYPLGTFIDDYKYNHRSGSLDENNGRFCITPDFPDGTYAYFITVDSNQVPQFPYILGEKFYSLPVDSNYNSPINQLDIPKNAKRFSVPGMPRNGEGLVAKIAEVRSGSVKSFSVDRTSGNFSVNSKLYFDNSGTDGSDVEALVSVVDGKPVSYLDSKENKVVKLTTIQNAYLFVDDTLRQPASGASGNIVGTVTDDNTIVLKNVVGTFNNTGTFSADIKTFIITVDQDSSYTKGATLSLTDGINLPIATAEILEGTSRQNTLKIKVLSGTWIIDDNYYLQSSNLFNTSGSKIVTLVSLSDNLEPFEVNQSVALIETTENHGLAIGDQVDISIFPDDALKTKNYYIRKRLYQTINLRQPKNSGIIDYDGIGRFTILNGGAAYTQGTYTNIPITGGSGTGAIATIIVSEPGVVSSVQITTGGSGYKRGDYLGVDDDQLGRSGGTLSSSRLAIYVDHAGVALTSSKMNLKSANGFAAGDLLSVGSEVIRIESILDTELTITRGLEGTEATDHYDGQSVSLYKPQYNFAAGFQITNGIGSGTIQSYDQATQTAIITYDYSIDKLSADEVAISSLFFDSSTPERLVNIESVSELDFKFEFSEDNVTFTPNPNIEIQEFYKYVFDTSHSSLIGTEFELSPSKSYNLLTLEKTASTTLPGNVGSFTEVKFGFGSRLSQNDYSVKRGTNFANFYYFDKNGVVNSEGSFFQLITDPLQGKKLLNYVTPNRFVYDVPKTPLWDGSGSITYTTSGQFAIGEIKEISVVNTGENYKRLPLIIGVDPTETYRGKATVLFDSVTKVITGVRIDELGEGYVNPKAIIVNGDGVGAKFKVTQSNGKLFSIVVENAGRGYTFAPEIAIVENDVEIYAESSDIGIPQGVTIINNGSAYHLDKTISSDVTSQFTLSLKNFSGSFQKGEIVTQSISGTEVMRSIVSEYRVGSNLIKLEKVRGIIRENVELIGKISSARGTVKSVFVSTFNTSTSSFYDNLGYYTSDKGRLGVANQRITDSFFYQDYSYVVKSRTSIEEWRDLIKATTHPAGFRLFGEVEVEVEVTPDSRMPEVSGEADAFTVIQLWDPEKNKITSDIKQRIITQSIQSVDQYRVKTGLGSAAASEFNFNETRAFTFTLDAPFDGTFNSDGQLVGTTVFQVIDDLGNPFNPISAESLIVTLDGIIQEPEVAYTVSQDKIIFAAPPLGPGTKLTGNSGTDLTPFNGTTFDGRAFYFKRSQFNSRYIRKIRNIFQRNGRWIDSANQIERNAEFIVEEAVGYGKEYYSSLDWSTKLDDYQNDIRFILDAYQHDLRFGGNTKVVDYGTIFEDTKPYITNNKTASLAIFDYVTKLAKLSIRNWDYVDNNVRYVQGSREVTVTSTANLVIGMNISSGRAFTPDTKIVSIDSATKVTLSKAALTNSGVGGGGAPDGITPISGTTSGDESIPTNTAQVPVGDTFSVQPGDTFSVPLSFSGIESATFYLSAINNGTYYDASNLIAANKEYLQEEVSGFVYANYSLPAGDQAKCYRDLGFLIDNIVYHLRYGGNARVVRFAQLYFTNRGYPYGEQLTYINRSTEETNAAIAAWDQLGVLMNSAMRNDLPAGNYTSIIPFTDLTVSVDTQFPYCQEVESSINTYIGIVKDIIANGSGIVEVVEQNENKSGQYTTRTTYSNYNIIPDPLLPAQECEDVISSVNSLYDNLSDTINSIAVEKTLPDFIDGETKEFDLYWSDGTSVIAEEDENLILTINAVLQETKYNASYPGDDSYYIDRTTIPNKLVFDVAPIWDQYEGAKTLGEPTAVEKVSGVGIGNYKRLTIDFALVDNVKSGPFLILDLEDLTVQPIEQNDNLLVFVDSVLQKEGVSYEVVGPNIFFKFPVTQQMKVDMRYLYGRDVGQIINLYDHIADTYYAFSNVTFNVTSGLIDFISFRWMGNYIGSPVHAYQLNDDGTYNMIGQTKNYKTSGNILTFEAFGQKADLDLTRDVYFAVAGRYDINTIVSITDGSTIVYERDEDNNLLLRGNDQNWRGTFFRKFYKNPFISLSNNSKIRVEGEEGFRTIKELPSVLVSKEQRPGEQVSNNYYGQVEVESYNGITRGEGLSVVAVIENGSVVDLTWNQRSYDPITQPTAYQYYTAPVLNFIPENGEGGGARGRVIVSKGQVISVELTNGGSGYTKPPKVVVARKYEVVEETEIGVSLINVQLNLADSMGGLTTISRISVLGNQVSGINTFTSILFNSPIDTDRVITAEIQLVEECSENLSAGLVRPLRKIDDFFWDDIEAVDAQYADTKIFTTVASLSDNLNIFSTSASRQITTTVSNVVNNTALSNINYFEVGSFLDLNLDANETIVYVSDTSKFKSNGYLLIGTEIVRYIRKLDDRFLSVQRGQDNTTAQFWAAGTFIRQIPDPVSVTYTGVALVESESQLVTLNAGATVFQGGKTQQQIITTVDLTQISTDIEVEVQPQINVESISSVQTRILYKLEPALENIQPIDTLHNQTQIQGQLLKQVEEFYTFDVTQTILDVAVNPQVTVTSQITVLTDVSSIVAREPLATAFSTFEHKETTVQGVLLKELTANTFTVSETIINVAVRPTITSTSEIVILTDIVSFVQTEPEITTFSTFEHKETVVQGVLLKELTANTFTVSETIVNVAVAPAVASTYEVTILSDIISVVTTEPEITTFSIFTEETYIENQVQTITPILSLTRNSFELLLIPAASGVADGFVENVSITDPIETRLNGFVDITNDYGVVQRDGTVIFVVNSTSTGSEYFGNFTTTNAGHTISHFDGFFDAGVSDVSSISIDEISRLYTTLTIADFAERGDSSYTLNGDKFTLMPPSIQNPVTTVTVDLAIIQGQTGFTVDATNTNGFPDSGYIFTSGGSLIQYTGKDVTRFTGCTLVNSPNILVIGQDIVPYTIS